MFKFIRNLFNTEPKAIFESFEKTKPLEHGIIDQQLTDVINKELISIMGIIKSDPETQKLNSKEVKRYVELVSLIDCIRKPFYCRPSEALIKEILQKSQYN